MSLRARLLVAYLVVVLVMGVALVAVVRGQRQHLTAQVDRQLSAARPFVPRDGTPSIRVIGDRLLDVVPPGPPDGAGATDAFDRGPISNLYVARLDAQGQTVLIAGVLLTDAPDVRVDDVRDLGHDGEPVLMTVRGQQSSDRFRVTIQPLPDGSWMVLALPLDEVDAAVSKLVVALAIVAGVVLAAMGLTMWWVMRLGVRPMARMTEAAGEIADGRRDRRVEYDDRRTEVGRLGRALNEMLDHQERSEDRLRQFVADASHELRTPLTSIQGGLDLVLDEPLDPMRREDVLRRVRRESHRMHDLVEDLLLLASLDSGRPLARDPVDIGAVVHDAADDARAVQPGRRVEVNPPSRGSTPTHQVIGDEMRIRQVVAGLVHNVLVHTPEDAVLQLGVRRVGCEVVVTVADTGPGLPVDQAASVFERFTRGDASRSRNRGGAGLGLAIAKSVVEAHGGTLALESSPGQGCTFTISLAAAETSAG